MTTKITKKKEKQEKEKDELEISANNLIKQPSNLLYKTTSCPRGPWTSQVPTKAGYPMVSMGQK
jgi:hypothetical protein